MVESAFALHELLDRGDARVLYAAAEAPVCELQELLGLLRRFIRRGDVDRLRYVGKQSAPGRVIALGPQRRRTFDILLGIQSIRNPRSACHPVDKQRELSLQQCPRTHS